MLNNQITIKRKRIHFGNCSPKLVEDTFPQNPVPEYLLSEFWIRQSFGGSFLSDTPHMQKDLPYLWPVTKTNISYYMLLWSTQRKIICSFDTTPCDKAWCPWKIHACMLSGETIPRDGTNLSGKQNMFIHSNRFQLNWKKHQLLSATQSIGVCVSVLKSI